MKALAVQDNAIRYNVMSGNATESNVIASQEFGASLLSDFFSFLDVSEKTRSTYQRALRQLFRYFTEQGISRPTCDDVLNFKKSLERAGRKPSTIALYLAAARRFFSWTEQRGICQNVAEGVKAPRQERGHKRDFLGATQLKAIFSCMKHDTLRERRDFAIMALMSVGGLRTIEVSRANVEDMRTLGDFTVLYVCGKGRKDRTEFVKLPAPVLKAINEYLALRGNVSDTAPLFASIGNRNRNGRMATRTISVIAKSALRRAGYNSSRLSAHSLRHSAVTLSLLGGMSLSEVQAFARHSSMNTTLIYSHAVDRIRSMCEDTVANAIF